MEAVPELFSPFMIGKVIRLYKEGEDEKDMVGILRGYYTNEDDQLQIVLDGIGEVVILDPEKTLVDVFARP